MRNEKRIPIVLDLFKNSVKILTHFLNIPSNQITNNIYDHWDEVESFWKEYPDLRLGQMLCNLRLIPSIDIENHIWNIEEDLWLIDNRYINLEDIKFWGINFYKNGNKRKTTKYVLLRDLKTDHIINIIKFFEKQNAFHRIPERYMKYFKKRIDE